MNGSLFLQKRSKRHMARLLAAFEEMVAPHLPASSTARGDVERFKTQARDTIKDLTGEGCDVIDATARGETLFNGAAAELRDSIEAGAT